MRGFTLIEVMAVVVLMGLLATGTVLVLSGQTQRMQAEDALGRLGMEDELARAAGRRLGCPCVLHIDMTRQRIWRTDVVNGEEQATHAWALPPECRIEGIWLAGESGEERNWAQVHIGTTGCSETYILRLTLTNMKDSNQPQTRWLVVAGLTGQRVLMNEQADVDNLQAMLNAPGHDAR